MTKIFSITVSVILYCLGVRAQVDSSLFRRIPQDTSANTMNMDALYNRPFLTAGRLPVSLGGYMEVNWQHVATDGASAGSQFQFRRISLFVSSTISQRIKFISEIEFENEIGDDDDAGDGPETEVEVEFAALDFEFSPLLNLRAGMLLNPIGGFNENHDGPKWEFTDRPIAMTDMLPDTWSNSGMGLYGKKASGNWMLGYEAYMTGGFDNAIISNSQNKTFLPQAKENGSRFVSSASGKPLYTARVSVKNNHVGEIGFSYMGQSAYNTYKDDDGDIIDNKRGMHVWDIDVNATISSLNTRFVGEWAWVHVQVPATYSQQYGSDQQGGYLDIIQPFFKGNILGWNYSTLNLACRFEYVDWNRGTFRETGGNIADNLWSIMPAISFRPNSSTVLRINYRIERQWDLLGNPPSRTGGFIIGISTYF